METVFSALACVLCAYFEPSDGKSLITVNREISESVVQCAQKRIELGKNAFEKVIFNDIIDQNGHSFIAVTYNNEVRYFKPRTEFRFENNTMFADVRAYYNMWYTYDELYVDTAKDLEILSNAWHNFSKTRE